MAEFGALGLVLGLWIVLAHQHGPRGQRRDGTLLALGWVLLALSALLVVTSGFPTDLTGLTSSLDTDGTTTASGVSAGGFGLQLLTGAQAAPAGSTQPNLAEGAGGTDGIDHSGTRESAILSG
ncbi:MAG TPA: hypothetical protein VH008_07955 [Pseudonocardia sp.]|jgi:hypothetical protein|nr:hypothetical protein [Pseudonocardia sp.]